MPTYREQLDTELNNLSDAINAKAQTSGQHTIAAMTTLVEEIPTPKTEETKNVTLDLSEGSQTVQPTSGNVFSSVTILKPNTLAAENIKKDVDIAGVTGTFEGGVTPEQEGIYVYDDGNLHYSASLPYVDRSRGIATIYGLDIDDEPTNVTVRSDQLYTIDFGSKIEPKAVTTSGDGFYAYQQEFGTLKYSAAFPQGDGVTYETAYGISQTGDLQPFTAYAGHLYEPIIGSGVSFDSIQLNNGVYSVSYNSDDKHYNFDPVEFTNGFYSYNNGSLEYSAALPEGDGETYATAYGTDGNNLDPFTAHAGSLYQAHIGSGAYFTPIEVNEGIYLISDQGFERLTGYGSPGYYYVNIGSTEDDNFTQLDGLDGSGIYAFSELAFTHLDSGIYSIGSDETYHNYGADAAIIPEEYNPAYSGYLFSVGSGDVAEGWPIFQEVSTGEHVTTSMFMYLNVGDSFTMKDHYFGDATTYQVTRLT